MIRLVFARAVLAVPLVVAVATAVFFLSSLSGVDPARLALGPDAPAAAVEAKRVEMGIDGSVWDQYLSWFGGVLHGDLGNSIYNDVPVMTSLRQALPITLSLTFGGLLVGMTFGVVAGIAGALRAGRAQDRVIGVLVAAGQSIPSFWLALLLGLVFAVQLGWFPATGYVGPTESVTGWLHSIALPSVSIGIVAAASVARQTRSAMIGVLQQEYVRAATARGLTRRRVVLKHAMKNAAAPVVTIVSFQAAALLGGSIVIERIFNLRGLGTIAIDAVFRRDPFVLQGIVLTTVVVIVLVNLALDVTYAWLNPKVRPS